MASRAGIEKCKYSIMERYSEVCEHYKGLLAYQYALETAYHHLHQDLKISDHLFQKYLATGFRSQIETTSRFISYLEIFVGTRWCLRNVLGHPSNGKKSEYGKDGIFQDNTVQQIFKRKEDELLIPVDSIFWELRNEFHHRRLQTIQPSYCKVCKSDSITEFKGHMIPTPHAMTNFHSVREKYPREVDYLTNESPFLIVALEIHFESVAKLHNFGLDLIAGCTERVFGKPLKVWM